MPCVGLNVPLGTIREKKLKDILDESEIIQDLRNFRGRIKGPCGTCERSGDCYGCRGAAYQLTGDYLASDPLCWKNAPHVHNIAKLPVAVDGFIPQRPPLRVVDRLLKVGDRNVEVEAVVRPDSPFVGADGVLEEAAFLEIIAQATAAMGGFKHYGASGRRDEGMLLGAKPLEVLGRARVGDVLTVSVFKSAQYGDFGIVRGTVHRGTELLAQGEVKIWHHLSEEALHA